MLPGMSNNTACGAVVGSRSASTEWASVSRANRTSRLLRACRADRSSEGRCVKVADRLDELGAERWRAVPTSHGLITELLAADAHPRQ